MATETAQAFHPSQAAESVNVDQDPARQAGSEGQTTATDLAEQPPTTAATNSSTTGEAVAGEARSLLDGIESVADLTRLTSQLPGLPPEGGTSPAVTEEATLSAEEAAALQPGAPTPKRIRLEGYSQSKRDAIMAIARSGDTPLEDILRALAPTISAPSAPAPGDEPTPTVRPQQPATPPAAEMVEVAPEALVPPTETTEGLRNQLSTLRKERSAAFRTGDLEGAADLDEQIGGLENRLPDVERAERDHLRAWDRTWKHSVSQAAASYPDVLKEDSPIAQEMARLDKAWEKTKDPMVNHPDKPRMLAALAATNLGINPLPRTGAKPAVSAVPARPAPVAAPTPRAAAPAVTPPAPAVGGARTQAPSPDAENAQARQALDSIQDTQQLAALLSGLK